MKYCRFKQHGVAKYGLVEPVGGEERITRLLLAAPQAGEGALDEVPSRRMDHLRLSEATLMAPAEPSKIICVGRNYREHAAELGNEVPTEPLIFLKPPSALLDPGLNIRRPTISERVDYEGELAVIIGRQCRNLPDDQDARPYILAYTCLNDVTARDLQNKDDQWTRAKGFDTFCPVGPVASNELDPWAGVEIETHLNGQVRQQGNTRDFIFQLDAIIRFISRVMTLFPGDLIATGTPAGVGPMQAGDVVEVKVEGVGTLSNPVVDE
jgi:2-keto-4-pentenoate hydratase/2-oxohepta-3-ene-1,7-dioic acid hydratase in catechol pathway